VGNAVNPRRKPAACVEVFDIHVGFQKNLLHQILGIFPIQQEFPSVPAKAFPRIVH